MSPELNKNGYAVDFRNLGDLLEPSDPRAVLANYESALQINRSLTQRSPDVQYARSVAISYGQIADVYADLGDYAREAENNHKGLKIYMDLVQADPKNALLRQGLAIAYVNTASALSRLHDGRESIDYSARGLEMMRDLVHSAPQNRVQKNVLAQMLAVRGMILMSATQPEAAIGFLTEARTVYESLSGSGDRHADAAACDVKMGEAALVAGRDLEASSYFHRALGIVEPLISGQSPDLDALYAAADANSGLGDVMLRKARRAATTSEQRRTQLTTAKSYYEQSLAIWPRIPHPNRTSPNGFQVSEPTKVANKLRQVTSELSSK